VVSPQQLAAKLRLPEAQVHADDFFFRILPPEGSVYWIADRF